MPYAPDAESVRSHPLPQWYSDAKLGIFIHWGPYSVPAWAPLAEDMQTLITQQGPSAYLKYNPYAEWYQNTILIEDSPSQRHHLDTYGPRFPYERFGDMFVEATQRFDASALADLVAATHARYAVLTTKHCDGFTLWPSTISHPHRRGWSARRDLVGDFASAIRERGMRAGLYYCGGYDWSFAGLPMTGGANLFTAIPQSDVYARHAESHVRELIERYEPAILWNDVAFPMGVDLAALFATYYNRVTDGVVNDRWAQLRLPKHAWSRRIVETTGNLAADVWARSPFAMPNLEFPRGFHCDFTTPEYQTFDDVVAAKWEATRGLGHSFGANHQEGPGDMLSVRELVHLLVDVVAKNGNLLISIGPRPDGTIPPLQGERVIGLGRWLDTNGEAIFDTTPWEVAEGATQDGTEVRFTSGDEALYAILLDAPPQREVQLGGITGRHRSPRSSVRTSKCLLPGRE